MNLSRYNKTPQELNFNDIKHHATKMIASNGEFKIVKEYWSHEYQMFYNPRSNNYPSRGVEVEVGEFLYSLVRLWKPEFIVETGAGHGISAAYMGIALNEQTGPDKDKGLITTCEVEGSYYDGAEELWEKLSIHNRIKLKRISSSDLNVNHKIDILFLDSEPHLRFSEFKNFWSNVNEGGLIVIHDLTHCLGETSFLWSPDIHELSKQEEVDPEYYWINFFGDHIKKYEIQLIHAPNVRGLTIFQKTDSSYGVVQYLRDEIQ